MAVGGKLVWIVSHGPDGVGFDGREMVAGPEVMPALVPGVYQVHNGQDQVLHAVKGGSKVVHGSIVRPSNHFVKTKGAMIEEKALQCWRSGNRQ